MIYRARTNTEVALNIVGSSTFGVYPKISIEKTYNMYISDGWLIDYLGYQSQINLGEVGRGIFTSTILDRMITVVDENVYLLNVIYNPNNVLNPYQFTPTLIGALQTFTGQVYFAENNGGQIALSDNTAIYIYNPNAAIPFQTFTSTTLGFIPGFITFHDTYFIVAASQDTSTSPPSNNTWRLSAQNDGTSWPATASNVGTLQTKPDHTQAVLRFPSRGNMIFVMGQTVTESWFNVGYQLFPYQRNTSANIDYGCISPATIASIDELVVWLAANEKSGPVIVYSDGGMVERISSDGIDNVLGSLSNPSDSEAFIFRSNGHIFYHINFYTDNLTLFYDFNTKRFFHASDENGNYFIAGDVAFFNNQYYFTTRNNGDVYSFNQNLTTYSGAEIPRIRTCKNVRRPSQDYFVVTDLGFTIEQGTTEPQYYDFGPCFLITEDGKFLITQGGPVYFVSQDDDFLVTQDDNFLIDQNLNNQFSYLVTEQDCFSNPIYPRVDLSVSKDGGESFSSYVSYNLNPLGKRRNMLRFWRLGIANDFVAQFRFWGLGRFVATDGVVNVRD